MASPQRQHYLHKPPSGVQARDAGAASSPITSKTTAQSEPRAGPSHTALSVSGDSGDGRTSRRQGAALPSLTVTHSPRTHGARGEEGAASHPLELESLLAWPRPGLSGFQTPHGQPQAPWAPGHALHSS